MCNPVYKILHVSELSLSNVDSLLHCFIADEQLARLNKMIASILYTCTSFNPGEKNA